MKQKWLTALIVVFALIFLGSAGYLAVYYAQSGKQAQIYNDLKNLLLPVESDTPPVTVQDPEGATLEILPEFAALYAENPDFAGWMTIDGTNLDYPVMFKPGSTDFYLRKNFYGEKAMQGCLYIQESCQVFPPSDQVVVFGHNMRDGTMFACLKKYLRKSFYEEHPTITFNTLTERAEYEIFAVFTTVTNEENDYPFYTYIQLPDEEAFRELVAPAKARSVYDTGVTPQFGDKILSLVTCEYSQENGRLVVMARKIS